MLFLFVHSSFLENITPQRSLRNKVELAMKNTDKSAVEIKYQLYTPIREDIYDYIIS